MLRCILIALHHPLWLVSMGMFFFYVYVCMCVCVCMDDDAV